ncbi:SPAG5 protein, partial [Sclerurus mexicanus]|nr:SPAG5 protein [Sclerurus mexicanus]
QNEKMLNALVEQQNDKILQLIEKNSQFSILNSVIFQLRRSLQHAETEAKVLWEELHGKEPKVDTTKVQERLWQQQEVDKLRLMLLEKENERQKLSDK